MLNKAKQKLTSDEQGTDNILDKAADFAKSKFSGQAETIDKVRDAIDDKIGSGDKGGPGTTADRPDKPVEPTDARAATGGTGPLGSSPDGDPQSEVAPAPEGTEAPRPPAPGSPDQRPTAPGESSAQPRFPDPTGVDGPTDPNQPPAGPSGDGHHQPGVGPK